MRFLFTRSVRFALFGMAALLMASACQPTVKVEAPDKPIEINLNVKIEQEVRVKVERDLEQTFKNDPSLFGLSSSSKGN